MAQPSLRRAILSWILLLLLAVGLGWITSRPASSAQLAGVGGIASLLRQHPQTPTDIPPGR
jgi:hypothetical protein